MNQVSPSEAVLQFAVWLTASPDKIEASSRTDAGTMAAKAEEFRRANGWEMPRDGWADGLCLPEHEELS